MLQVDERDIELLDERVDSDGDYPVRYLSRRSVLPLEDPLYQTDAVRQKPWKQVMEVIPSVRFDWELAAHLEPQVTLLPKVEHEAVRGIGERPVSDLDHGVLNDQIHLIQKEKDAQSLVDDLLFHSRDEPADTAPLHVITDRADRQQHEKPRNTQML